jgi:hypothetical protein
VPTSWQELYNPNLQATHNSTCVDIPSATHDVYAALQMWTCHATAADGISQRWTFVPVSPGQPGTAYEIVNQGGSNLCLGMDLRMTQTVPYAQWSDKSLVQETCGAGDVWDTRWSVLPTTQSPDPANQVEIVSEALVSGQAPYCLAADNFRDTNGVRVVALPCSPYDSRQWWSI